MILPTLGDPIDLIELLNRAAKFARSNFEYELAAELGLAAAACGNCRDGACSMDDLAWWWGFTNFDNPEAGTTGEAARLGGVE